MKFELPPDDDNGQVEQVSEANRSHKIETPSIEGHNKIQYAMLTELRAKYPYENLLSEERLFRTRNTSRYYTQINEKLAQQRYENALSCGAEIHSTFIEFGDKIKDSDWINCLKNYPMNGINRIFDKNETPFAGFFDENRIMEAESLMSPYSYFLEGQFGRAVEFKPDIVAVTPKSGIMPSIIVKQFFRTYSEETGDNIDPQFFIPQSKFFSGFKSTDNGRKYIKDILSTNLGSIEDYQKYLENSGEILTGKSVSEKDLAKIQRYKKTFEAIKNIIISHTEEKEIKVLVFDEVINEGKSSKGMQELFEVILDILKEGGEIPKDTVIKSQVLTMGSLGTSYNSPGKDFIMDEGGNNYNYGLKGSSKAKHHLTRKVFKIIGESLAKEFILVRNS